MLRCPDDLRNVRADRANASCSTVACITALSPYQLHQAAQWVDQNNDGAGLTLAFSPVVDGVDVIDAPWLLAKQGHTHHGPLMLGTARDEGQMFCPACPSNMTEAGFRSWAVSEHGYQGADADTLVDLYKGHAPCTGGGPYFEYFGHWTEWAWAAIELTGDAGFHCGARLGARWVSGRQPVYICKPHDVDASRFALPVAQDSQQTCRCAQTTSPRTKCTRRCTHAS